MRPQHNGQVKRKGNGFRQVPLIATHGDMVPALASCPPTTTSAIGQKMRCDGSAMRRVAVFKQVYPLPRTQNHAAVLYRDL